MTRRTPMLLLLGWTVAVGANGQSPKEQPSASSPSHPPHAIQDNSFLVEEAYNQEEGVVQHISQLQMANRGGEWTYTFTQEWPADGIRHQLSYTLPLARVAASKGVGDVALNYRYQLAGDDLAKVAVAPRFSLFLPTGRSPDGLGAGGVTFQVSIPVSVLISDDWIVHGNGGASWTPSARNAAGERAGLAAWSAGASVIWLGSRFLDPMLETIYVDAQSVAGPGRTFSSRSFYVSPGIRWAYLFRSGLQIVPGLAFPIGLGPSRGSRQLLVYLSFEHPFRRVAAPHGETSSP